jgi:RNase P/RNase MRP subunit POP5
MHCHIVKYYSSTTGICIIRVGREHVRIARAGVTLLTSIEGSSIIPVVLHCSGGIDILDKFTVSYPARDHQEGPECCH